MALFCNTNTGDSEAGGALAGYPIQLIPEFQVQGETLPQ